MTPLNRRPLVLVAAVARNGVIGAGGRLPWHLPGDLAHFRELTWGHPLLMGRVTYGSIGRPLPGRLTTVLSRTAGFSPPGVAVAHDLRTALASADRQADELGAAAVMVVGGATLYAATLGLARTLLITEVAMQPAGDAFFPPIDPQKWREAEAREVPPGPDNDHGMRLVRWERL